MISSAQDRRDSSLYEYDAKHRYLLITLDRRREKKTPTGTSNSQDGIALPRVGLGNHSILADAQLQTSKGWWNTVYEWPKIRLAACPVPALVAQCRRKDQRQTGLLCGEDIHPHTSSENNKRQQKACLSRSFATAFRLVTRPTSKFEQCNSPGRALGWWVLTMMPAYGKPSQAWSTGLVFEGFAP